MVFHVLFFMDDMNSSVHVYVMFNNHYYHTFPIVSGDIKMLDDGFFDNFIFNGTRREGGIDPSAWVSNFT